MALCIWVVLGIKLALSRASISSNYIGILITQVEKSLKHIFSAKLKELSTSKGVKQTVLASALAIPQSSVSSYMTGKSLPRVDEALLIAEYFGVPMEYLFREEICNPDRVAAPQIPYQTQSVTGMQKSVIITQTIGHHTANQADVSAELRTMGDAIDSLDSQARALALQAQSITQQAQALRMAHAVALRKLDGNGNGTT
jgi:DNA-binding XRE family transcriptional regulator